MRIISIETSCDDTSVAILEGFKIISNIVSSQEKIHSKWGGVYPSLAKREHKKNLTLVLEKALKKSKDLERKKGVFKKKREIKEILTREEGLSEDLICFLEKYKKPKIKYIAVTIGPGLDPCLWTGLNFAKALSVAWNLPIVPINHIEAHILSNWISLEKPLEFNKLFPAISLIISGGHTQLIMVKRIGDYKIIGETRDDAAGECFDKTARVLGLKYPGGPEISKYAKESRKSFSISFPRPMISSKDYDFSFSGLKTAVLYHAKNNKDLLRKISYKRAMAKEIQQAIIDVLLKKTFRAAADFNVKTILIGGGVSANEELRRQFEEEAIKKEKIILFPLSKFTGDNAAMIGITSLFKKEKDWKKIKVNANLKI